MLGVILCCCTMKLCWLIHFNHCKVVVFFICNSSQNKWCVYRAYCNIQHQHYTHCRHPSNINIIHIADPSNINIIHIADIHSTSTLYTLQTSIQHQHYTHCRHPSNINIMHIADIHSSGKNQSQKAVKMDQQNWKNKKIKLSQVCKTRN